MVKTIKEFEECYGGLKDGTLDDNKKQLLIDFQEIIRTICEFFSKILTTSQTKWEIEVLISSAILKKEKPIQNDIAKCIGTDSKNISDAINNLKGKEFIRIEQKGRNKRIIINEEQSPQLKLISEIIRTHWECRSKRESKFQAFLNT